LSSSISSKSPSIKLFFFIFFIFKFIIKFIKKNFLEIGNIIKNPKISVANPGMIKSNAAKAIAAPEIISYAGASFLLNCKNPDLRVFKPSYLA
jgi:hypothetical protein